MLTVAQAAERLGLSLPQTRLLARTGRLPGAVHTSPENPRRGEWRIPESALAAYRNEAKRAREEGKVGRPPLAQEGVDVL